uniref:hypothetical protein n=1 Tax=Psammodictyon constrictum TaxID=515483 RepID=UPI001EF9EAA2|nr:hypothetical protein MKU01_pgp151 [Psammodictyon constrictum]ULD16342.1 hypothetical protein [Psammodictyon constrictum]
MQDKLKNLIERFQNDGDLVIRNQNFLNEIIFESIFSVAVFDQVSISNCKFEEAQFLGSHFSHCIFKNCRFQNSLLRKCEFWGCTFQNCEILDCEISKTEFDEHIFKNCQFHKVGFGWSHFMDCEFLETKLDDINFEATIINDLKTKNTTFLNLHFNKKFPVSFWKSNHRIDITNSLSFENFLKDMTYE